MGSVSKPLISISILNWNGLEDTKTCLDSVRKLDYPNYEIIIVDNGSSDGSKNYLDKQSDIVFIDLPENLGFTGGHLTAAKKANGEYLLILNNDLVVDSQWINRALETFSRHRKAAVVGGKLYKWDKNNPLFDRSNDYNAYQEIDPITGHAYTMLVGEEECRVDSISGASLIMKREILEELGYFDNDFFAYYEETDLIARMLRAGYEAYYNPEAAVWHRVAASSKGGLESAFFLYMMHRNRYMYATKNFDNDYLGKFYRSYRAEVAKSLLVFMRRGGLEPKIRLKAYLWNIVHRHKSMAKRRAVLKLGPTYTKKLRSYKPQEVTIVIPCYNYAEYVAEAIDSALAQTLKPKSIIVINDGSTDNSGEVIDRYKNNPLVEIVTQKNSGIVASKNLGIKKSQTYWTVFLDADDILGDDYLEKTVNLANDKFYDVVYTDMEYFGAVSDIYRSRPFSLFPMLQRNIIHNSALIKTSRLKQVGGYKEEMRGGLEDWELYLSLYEIGSKFGYLPEVNFKYRQHAGALSRNINVQKNSEPELYQKLICLHPRLFRHMSHTRRRMLRVVKTLIAFTRYPYLFVILIKSLPRAFISAGRTSLHEVRAYIQSRTDE